MIRQMNRGLTSSDVKVELLQEERGGLTGDGTAIYKVSINEDCDTSEIDNSGWKSLPIDEEIVDCYMLNNYSAGRTLSKLQKGRWKLAGKNKVDGMYANILLFVYDEDGHCFYIYEWDS